MFLLASISRLTLCHSFNSETAGSPLKVNGISAQVKPRTQCLLVARVPILDGAAEF